MERLCRWCNGHFKADSFAKAWCHCHGSSIHCSRDCVGLGCLWKRLDCREIHSSDPPWLRITGERSCHRCASSGVIHEDNATGVCRTCKEPVSCFPLCLNEPVMAYKQTWFYYDKRWDRRHEKLYNSAATYCAQCFPVVSTDPIKAFLRGPHGGDSYLSLLPPEIRGLVAPLVTPTSDPCCVCLRHNVPMYGRPPRYGFSHLCLDCNKLIEGKEYGVLTERTIAKCVHDRQCIPKILKVVNSRIVKSNSRLKRKKSGANSPRKKLLEDLVNKYYSERGF